MSEKTYEGLPRSKIPWYPTIDYEKCISCGKCVDYCKLGVFEFEEHQGKKEIHREESLQLCGFLHWLRGAMSCQCHNASFQRRNQKDY